MQEMKVGYIDWFELMTVDPDASVSFYSGLFGWKLLARPGAPKPYYVIHDGARNAGGVTESPVRAPFPKWISYVTVADVDATAAQAVELGSELQLEPWDLPGIGRAAVIMDPFGASFGIVSYLPVEARDPSRDPFGENTIRPPEPQREPGQFCWQTLNIVDRERAADFYRRVIGWDVAEVEQADGRSLHLLVNDDTPVASIATVASEGAILPHWQISIAVADIEQAAQAVIAAGGRVTTPAFQLEGMGISAIVEDPTGTSFSIFEIDREGMTRTLRL